MKKFFIWISVIGFYLLFGAWHLELPDVFAQTTSSVYFSSQATNYGPGSEFQVSVLLDSPQPINALDLEVSYDPEILGFLGFDTSGSIIEVWQNSPSLLPPDILILKGGLFRGFEGEGGVIVKLNFRALKNGNTNLTFKSSKIYLADGKGTEFLAAPRSYVILIDQNSEVTKISANPDLTPPNIEVQIIEEPVQGQKLLSYRTYDNESGVSYTIARFKKWFGWSEWINAPNPIIVPRGTWATELRTSNNNGVMSQETLIFKGELIKKGLILLGIIILVIIAALFYNKRRHKKSRTFSYR